MNVRNNYGSMSWDLEEGVISQPPYAISFLAYRFMKEKVSGGQKFTKK